MTRRSKLFLLSLLFLAATFASATPEQDLDLRLPGEPDEDPILWLKQNGGLPQYYCLNGQNSTKMTAKQQAIEFAKGPCSPIATVPGHQSTRLQVQIDCNTLREKQPVLFSKCGWNSCTRNSGKMPDPEYSLWIPSPLSPFSIIELKDDQAQCFGGLFSVVYDPTQTDPEKAWRNGDGLTVTWYGNTKLTKPFSRCGATSGEDLLDFPFAGTLCSACVAFRKFRLYLEYLGYQEGLTYQHIAYDFRPSVHHNEGKWKLIRAIKFLHGLTGKKVSIAAHSLGNLITSGALNEMNQADKDKMVNTFISMAPPFLGSPKVSETVFGGNPDFVYFGIGLLINAQKPLVQTHGTIVDLLPHAAFDTHKEHPFLQEVLERAHFEDIYNPDTAEGKAFWESYKQNTTRQFSFFPTPADKCFDRFTSRPATCRVDFMNGLNVPFVTVEGKNYHHNHQDIYTALANFSMKGEVNLKEYIEVFDKTGIPSVRNLGVQVALVYYSHVSTLGSPRYNKNPRSKTDKGDFYPPDQSTNSAGDGTVPNFSALFGPLKWAYEFQNPSTVHHGVTPKPVKILEGCSVYGTRNSAFDTAFPDKVNQFSKNEYIGLPCDCQVTSGTTKADKCSHATIIGDQQLLNWIGAGILDSKDYNKDLVNAAITGYTDDAVKKIVSDCPTLTAPKDVSSIHDFLLQSLEAEVKDQ